MTKSLRCIVPARVRRGLRRWFSPNEGFTESEGWDHYARAFTPDGGRTLGDEWNAPAVIGLDMPQEHVVPYLDREVIGPALGRVEVMLEIGPGGGRFTGVLLDRCRRLLAADTSPAMLKLLRSRYAGCDGLDCIRLDGRGLAGVADASVDAAFSYGVFVSLQHWDIWNYVAELKRVLKPGGRALIHHFHAFSDAGWERFLREVPMALNRHKPFGVFTLMTPEIMAEFAERAGLMLESCRTDVVPRHALSLLRAPGANERCPSQPTKCVRSAEVETKQPVLSGA